MEIERLEEIFDADYSRDNETADRVLTGLNILAKYTTKPVIGAAEHDIIYCCDVDDVIDSITEEDAIKLRSLGFGLDSEYDCFYHFV